MEPIKRYLAAVEEYLETANHVDEKLGSTKLQMARLATLLPRWREMIAGYGVTLLADLPSADNLNKLIESGVKAREMVKKTFEAIPVAVRRAVKPPNELIQNWKDIGQSDVIETP